MWVGPQIRFQMRSPKMGRHSLCPVHRSYVVSSCHRCETVGTPPLLLVSAHSSAADQAATQPCFCVPLVDIYYFILMANMPSLMLTETPLVSTHPLLYLAT